MSLRVRHLVLRVQTAEGLVGTSIPFSNGLNILRADNTSGKSTCLQSIIYALGLEGMWSPSHDIPLAHAMTDHIEVTDRSLPVVWSDVMLEISNGEEIFTIRRGIKNAGQQNLISTWNKPLISDPSSASTATQKDYFVRQAGAALSEAGFHNFLSKLIGWQLPMVPKFQGGDTTLYMEGIFPLLFVEQKRGWSNIPARFPTYLQIREIGRRAVEFILRLDSYEIEATKQRLKDEEADLRARWRAAVTELGSLAGNVGAYIQGLPREPTSIWPLPSPPKLLFSRNNQWLDLQSVLAEERSKIVSTAQQSVPTAGQFSGEATTQLRLLEEELARLEFSSSTSIEELQNERLEEQRLTERLSGIDEELRRTQDAEKLARLGSVQHLKLADGICPTCDQPLSDTLASQRVMQNVMPLAENAEYLKDQRDIMLSTRERSARRIQALEVTINSIRSRADGVRAQIRSLRSTLTSSNETPSISVIQERLKREEFVQRLSEVDRDFSIQLESVGRLVSEFNSISARRAALPRSSISTMDESKLNSFQEMFINHVRAFGFTSLRPESLSIDPSTFRPIHGGFELEFDLSASDAVRVIWSYLVSLLEMGRKFPTNHPGLLILDEPRQQSARSESLGELLRSAGTAGQLGQQIIIGTSEDPQSLRSLLKNVVHSRIDFEGRILKPWPS